MCKADQIILMNGEAPISPLQRLLTHCFPGPDLCMKEFGISLWQKDQEAQGTYAGDAKILGLKLWCCEEKNREFKQGNNFE